MRTVTVYHTCRTMSGPSMEVSKFCGEDLSASVNDVGDLTIANVQTSTTNGFAVFARNVWDRFSVAWPK